MASTRDRYHHGALRAELLRASLQLIEEEGLAAVSLRRVAREAGVSPGAPYHHFADRAALLAALSADGFGVLRDRLIAVRDSTDASRVRLTALADAYIRFAWEFPAYFRLMFRPELSRPDEHPDTLNAGDAAFAVLEETIADAVQDGYGRDDAATLAVTWWSLAHGVAALGLDGQLAKRAELLGTDATTLAHRVTRLFTATLGSADSRQ